MREILIDCLHDLKNYINVMGLTNEMLEFTIDGLINEIYEHHLLICLNDNCLNENEKDDTLKEMTNISSNKEPSLFCEDGRINKQNSLFQRLSKICNLHYLCEYEYIENISSNYIMLFTSMIINYQFSYYKEVYNKFSINHVSKIVSGVIISTIYNILKYAEEDNDCIMCID